MATRQEVFNRAYLGLASQGFQQSKSSCGPETSACMYRGANGRRCAIGWCIPDEKYDPNFEGKNVLENWKIVRAIGLDITDQQFGPDLQFARSLQVAHDAAKTSMDMRYRLDMVAKKYHLTVPEISEASS